VDLRAGEHHLEDGVRACTLVECCNVVVHDAILRQCGRDKGLQAMPADASPFICRASAKVRMGK
jgi:hypothetical protein